MMAGGGWIATQVPFCGGPPWSANAIAYGLISMGFIVATLRHGMVLDRASGLITTWTGLVLPLLRRTRPMEVNSVRLTREEYHRKGMTSVFYPVNLVLPKTTLFVGQVTDAIKAWAMSQELAEFLDVPLVDESSTA